MNRLTEILPVNRSRDPFRIFSPWLEDFFFPVAGEVKQEFRPLFDVEETDKEFSVAIDLPGVRKEDIQIEQKGRDLIVSGQRKPVEKTEPEKGFRSRRWGSFQRVFTLPDSVNGEGIEATYNDGVLRVSLPKAESAKPRKIKVA